MKFYPRVNVTDQDKMSLHLRWKKTKCLCRFLDSMTKSQSRISKKDSHKAEGKMPIPKQFQNRNWQAEVRMVCNGEHCLHWLMIEVRKVCNGEHCLHWWKLFCLWIYNVQLYFKNNFPFQNPAYEVCSMERWSSKPGKCFNQSNGMSVVESHTVISLHRYFISHVGVLPEWCTGMGQTSTSNVTRYYQGATLWDKGKTKWVPLLINELVQYHPFNQRGAGYKDSTPKWMRNRPPNTESVNMYP